MAALDHGLSEDLDLNGVTFRLPGEAKHISSLLLTTNTPRTDRYGGLCEQIAEIAMGYDPFEPLIVNDQPHFVMKPDHYDYAPSAMLTEGGVRLSF